MCALETTPILNMSFNVKSDYTPFSAVGTDYRLFPVVENVTQSLKVPIHFLNITALSEYRKDAHTSVYTIKQGKLLTREQQADPANFADCIHWCLPGLPDTWNEFLYTHIISQRWNYLDSFILFYFGFFKILVMYIGQRFKGFELGVKYAIECYVNWGYRFVE